MNAQLAPVLGLLTALAIAILWMQTWSRGVAAFRRAASRMVSTFSMSLSGSKLKRNYEATSDWNDAIAIYLAAKEESCAGSNIFAKLNAIRCEFAIRNGHDNYIALRNDGSTETVYINWQFFEVEGLEAPNLIRHSRIELRARPAASISEPSFDVLAMLTRSDATMSEEGGCLNGSPDCTFGGMHELVLVEKIMGMIGNYSQDKRISPCPVCVRDTMLAVAALLHLDAAKLDATAPGQGKGFDDEFAKAARARISAVTEAVRTNVASFKQ